jgi:hypothetical protein
MRIPVGFHVTGDTRGDSVGLTTEELAEERSASNAPARRPRGTRNGSRRDPPVRNPFDEFLKSLGLWERVLVVCKEHGVLPVEIGSENMSRRVCAAREKVYGMLVGVGWSGADIARLFGRDQSTVNHTLKKAGIR